MIDRHLCTVADFQSFIDAGGYHEPSFWSPEGWRWLRGAGIEAPRFWGEAEWAAYLAPDHPVVGVSAYEAEAYASFAGAALPSVAEWQASFAGRRYPWGDEWREGLCGHRDDGTRGTRPVGSFPPTADGIYDLCGAVWQWSRDGGRIACGGAWNNLPWSLGGQARNVFPPTARFSHIGFRCIR